MRDARGFVLVNALILVMALSAVAVGLLMLAETARARHNTAQTSAQLRLYLDGFEALAVTLLNADRGAVMDHAGETWARPIQDLPVDRGTISGRLNDLQGQFNVNWLSNVDDVAAKMAFAELLTKLGLPATRGQAIISFLTPGNTVTTSQRAQYYPQVAINGGPVLMVEQLMLVPGMRAKDMRRLLPYVTALPGDSLLNVNTASATVMQSLLPEIGPAVVDQIVQYRQRRPFTSIEEFTDWFGADGAKIDDTRFAVGSNWFHAEIEAQLEGQEMRRDTVFERQPLPKSTRVFYRLNKRD